MAQTLRRGFGFVRREMVLCLAVLLALASMLLVKPGRDYLGYIDWNTLALLFSLMAVMTGLQKLGVFSWLGGGLLRRVSTSRQLLFVLVFLPFVCSMLITNDVALITFVPFGLIVLKMAGQERLMVPMVVLQTVAANLGSMTTPMGNPQNLYLFTQSGMGFGPFLLLMLPYVLLSGVCLAVLILLRKNREISCAPVPVQIGSRRGIAVCCAGFVLCLLALADLIPPLAVAAITAVFLLVANRPLLAQIDYSLLGTFVALFIFIGNMGRVPVFQNLIQSVLAGHEELVAVVTSQFISNVPAALLLSGFTDHWQALIIGCNLGGLGTLIASMASLISYKQIAAHRPDQRKRYLISFTLCNVLLLVILLPLGLLL